jgi:DNA invertase Pin-like site-specific DNA recombinase
MTSHQAEARPRAYSYVRFSTPDQMKGHSFQRQVEKATAYAAAKGLELDTELTLHDLGVSAFHGRNSKTGALAEFLAAVGRGEVPVGSFLLVESLDRISRDEILEAQGLFSLIISRGVTLVTLIDGKAYSKGSVNANPTDLIIAIVAMIRAHEESATKSRRLRDVNEHKRKQAATRATDKPFTRRLPGWLRFDEETKRHALVPERARIVRIIYEKSLAGWGQDRIARWLNTEGEPTWGDAERWHRSYIKKVLTNSATIGTFTPHSTSRDDTGRRIRSPQSAVENYFPAAVEREVFDAVALRQATTQARGRHANTLPRSIFAGLLRCGRCGGTVSRVSKGTHVYLVCAKANSRAGCQYLTVPYQEMEDRFCEVIGGIIAEAPRGRDTEELEDEIAGVAAGVYAVEEDTEAMAEHLVGESDSPAIRKKMRELEARLDKERVRLAEMTAERDRLTDRRVKRRLDALEAVLSTKPLDVVKANTALRDAVSKIVLDIDTSELRIHWHHVADDESQEITWWTRHQRWDVTIDQGEAER